MAEVIIQKESPSLYAARVVWSITGVVEAVLALRFVLRLIGANPAAGFTDFMYDLTRPLLAPFSNVVRNSVAGSGVFEWTTLIAMTVYWLIAWAIVRLFFLSESDDEVDVV